jgi:hypothetical protein
MTSGSGLPMATLAILLWRRWLNRRLSPEEPLSTVSMSTRQNVAAAFDEVPRQVLGTRSPTLSRVLLEVSVRDEAVYIWRS